MTATRSIDLRRMFRRHWPEYLLTSLVLAAFARVLFTQETFYLRDINSYVAPLKSLWRERLLSGQFPEWIPNIALGVPLVADPSNQALYPLSLCALLPEPFGLEVFIVLHILIAGLGALRLARLLGANDAGAFLSGVSFSLSGYVVTVATTNCLYMCSAAFIPWIVLTMAELHTGVQPRHVSRLSALFALQLLGGDFQASLFAGAAGLAMVFFVAPPKRSPNAARNALRSMVGYSISAVVGALLAAPQVLPTLLFAPHSIRRQPLSLDQAQTFSTHPWRLLDIFAPHPWGVPFADYFGSGFEGGVKTIPWSLSLYVGAASLALIPLAVSAGAPESKQRARRLVLLVCLGIALSLGAHTPVYAWFHEHIPLFGRFRFPEKTFVLSELLLALLIGLGVSAARSTRAGSSSQLYLPTVVLGLVLVLVGAMHHWDDPFARSLVSPSLPYARALLAVEHVQARLLIALLVGAVVLWAWRSHRVSILLAICVLDLLIATAELPVSASIGGLSLAPPIADLVRAGQRERVPTRFYDLRQPYDGAGGPLVEQAASYASFRNRHLSDGVSYINGHTSSLPFDGWVWSWGLLGHPVRMARLAATTSIIAPLDSKGPFSYAGEQFRVGPFAWLSSPESSPRAYMLTTAYVAATDPEAGALMYDERFPIDRVALLRQTGPGEVARLQPGIVPLPAEPCELKVYEPERVRFACDAKQPSIAVLADQFLEGWTLTVDGAPATSYPVQFALRGATLQPGKHHLEYKYSTPGLRWGGLACGTGCLIILLISCAAPIKQWASTRRGPSTRG